MDINFIKYQLKVGMEFKNREELSNYLNEPYIIKTNPKKAQDKVWRQYFDFERIEGTQMIKITEVYDKVNVDFSTRGSSLPKVFDPALFLVLKDEEYITCSEIARRMNLADEAVIGFYNENEQWKTIANWLSDRYRIYNESADDLYRIKNMDSFKRTCFFISTIQNSYISKIDGALSRLEKKQLIENEKTMMISFPNDYTKNLIKIIRKKGIVDIAAHIFPWIYQAIEESLHIDDLGIWVEDFKMILSNFDIIDGLKREATTEEKAFIEDIKAQTDKEFGYDTSKEAYSASLWDMERRKAYFRSINQKLSKYNVKTFKAYHIKKLETQVEIDRKVLREVNEAFYQSIIRRNEKSLQREFDEAMMKVKNQRLSQPTLERELSDKEKPFRDFVDKFVKVS